MMIIKIVIAVDNEASTKALSMNGAMSPLRCTDADVYEGTMHRNAILGMVSEINCTP